MGLSNNKLILTIGIIVIFAITIFATVDIESTFPTIGQRRSINRLLGPLGSIHYQFSHQIKRILSPNDISSILFQDHTELQLPFRTQLILSQQRREEMVNRLLLRRDNNQSNSQIITIPFILPTLLNHNKRIPNPIDPTEYISVPIFTADDLTILNLLQQLQSQSPIIKQHQSQHLQTSLSQYYQSFDLLNEHEPTDLNDDARHAMFDDYKQHLFQTFSTERVESNFIAYNLGSESPLYNNGGLDVLDLDIDRLPILIQQLPLFIEKNIIFQRFIQNNPQFQSIYNINQYITTFLQRQQSIIQQSQKLLAYTLVDMGSTAYIHSPEQYSFWLQFLSPMTQHYYDANNNQVNKNSINYVYTLQEHLLNQDSNILAYHPYYLWESYELPIQQPTRIEIDEFYMSQQKRMNNNKGMNCDDMKNEEEGVNNELTVAQFFEQFLNIEFTFENPLTLLNNHVSSSKISSSTTNMNHFEFTTKEHQNQIGTIFQLFQSKLSSTTNVQSIQLTDNEQLMIQKLLPQLHMNLFYTHQFYTKTQQEELLLSNIDLQGIVTLSLHTNALTNLKLGRYIPEITTVLQQYFNTILTQQYGNEFTSIATQFNTFITNDILQQYLSTILTTTKINILHPSYLTTIINDKKDVLLSPQQLQQGRDSSIDVQFNLNEEFWLFQTLHRVQSTHDNHNGQQLPRTKLLEIQLNSFLLTYTSHIKSKQTTIQQLQSTSSNTFLNQLLTHMTKQSQLHTSSQCPLTYDNDTNDQCNDCKDREIEAYNELRRTFPDTAISVLTPFCHDIWPSLAPIIGPNMCDPTIKDECVTLCLGMLNVYKDSVSDLVAFLQHDPERTCYKNGQCSYNPDDKVPEFPQQDLKSEDGDETTLRKIFHLTDVHWDHLYSQEPGSRVRCKLPVCCHKTNTTISNENGGIPGALFTLQSLRSETPRKYGEYLCDAPQQLVISSVEQIALYCPEFAVFTGDAPAHDLWLQNQKDNMNAVEYVTQQISSHLDCKQFFNLRLQSYQLGITDLTTLINSDEDPITYRAAVLYNNLSVEERLKLKLDDEQRNPNFEPRSYPTIGNHLYAPVNHFAGFGIYDDWFLIPLSKLWGAFLPPDSTATVRFGGFYVRAAGPKNFIISMHTGLYDHHNPWRMLNLGHWDPSGQGHFLETILYKINALGGKAILIMHEPHGDLIKGPAQSYIASIYRKYAKVISFVLAGHEHHDFTKIIHNDFPVNITSSDYLTKQFYHQGLQRPYDTHPLFKHTQYNTLGHIKQQLITTQYQFGLKTKTTKTTPCTTTPTSKFNGIKDLEPIILEFLPSSVTPMNYETNPSFRVIDFKNHQIDDYYQYVFDVSTQGDEAPSAKWVLKYKASELYGITPFTPSKWHQLLIEKENDDKFFEQYTLRYWGYIPDGIDPEFQEVRWKPIEALCNTFTHSDIEAKYCIEHWKD